MFRREYLGTTGLLLSTGAGCLGGPDRQVALNEVWIDFLVSSGPENDFLITIEKNSTEKYREKVSIPTGEEYDELHEIEEPWLRERANYTVTVGVIGQDKYTIQTDELIDENTFTEHGNCSDLIITVIGTDPRRFEPWLTMERECPDDNE
jgi:hypothetical protein